MSNDNTQKKKLIDEALAKYNTRMRALEKKHNKIISDFLEVLKEKRIAELRDLIKQL